MSRCSSTGMPVSWGKEEEDEKKGEKETKKSSQNIYPPTVKSEKQRKRV
jgi:hypothetical protein